MEDLIKTTFEKEINNQQNSEYVISKLKEIYECVKSGQKTVKQESVKLEAEFMFEFLDWINSREPFKSVDYRVKDFQFLTMLLNDLVKVEGDD